VERAHLDLVIGRFSRPLTVLSQSCGRRDDREGIPLEHAVLADEVRSWNATRRSRCSSSSSSKSCSGRTRSSATGWRSPTHSPAWRWRPKAARCSVRSISTGPPGCSSTSCSPTSSRTSGSATRCRRVGRHLAQRGIRDLRVGSTSPPRCGRGSRRSSATARAPSVGSGARPTAGGADRRRAEPVIKRRERSPREMCRADTVTDVPTGSGRSRSSRRTGRCTSSRAAQRAHRPNDG
jgi:hypothetical protein